MQVVMNAGAASLSQAGPGFASLRFPGYAKAGDALTLTFARRSRPCAKSRSAHGWTSRTIP